MRFPPPRNSSSSMMRSPEILMATAVCSSTIFFSSSISSVARPMVRPRPLISMAMARSVSAISFPSLTISARARPASVGPHRARPTPRSASRWRRWVGREPSSGALRCAYGSIMPKRSKRMARPCNTIRPRWYSRARAPAPGPSSKARAGMHRCFRCSTSVPASWWWAMV